MNFVHAIDEHLTLRPASTADADELFRLIDANRDHLTAWLNWPHLIRTADDVRRNAVQCAEQHARGSALHCNIAVDGRLVGRASLEHILSEQRHTDRMKVGRAEIGYWLASDVQGRGIMTRTVNALLDHAFGELALERVYLTAEPANRRSCAVAERCGMTCEGTMRHVAEYDGRIVDHRLYALLRHEWRALRAEPTPT